MKRLVSYLLIVFLLLFLVACQSGSGLASNEASTDEPIRIGVSLPLTGRFEGPGTGTHRGYETWVDLVNEAGGLLGRPVELVVVDNGSDPDVAVADYEKLITEDQVDLVVGPFSSFLVIPTSEVAAQHGYAFVEPAGGAPEVFSRGLDNLFFAQPGVAASQGDPFSLYILSLPEDQRPQTFAIVAEDDPFAQGMIQRSKTLLTDGGLEMVYEVAYLPGEADFAQIADEVAALNPDLLLASSFPEDAVAQVQAYQAADYQPHFAFIGQGPTVPEIFKGELGTATEGIFSSISWYPESKEYQNNEFVTRYLELFGGSLGDIPEDAANAFTVGQILQQAVEKIDSIDNTELIEELHRGTYDTVVGSISFDETGAPQGAYMLLQWQGDNFVIVGPSDRAEMDPIASKPTW